MQEILLHSAKMSYTQINKMSYTQIGDMQIVKIDSLPVETGDPAGSSGVSSGAWRQWLRRGQARPTCCSASPGYETVHPRQIDRQIMRQIITYYKILQE